MNLGWGPSYLEFKNAGANLSKISSTAANIIDLEGTAPGQDVRVRKVADPISINDAANKRYVDTKVATGPFVRTDNSTQQKTGLFTFANTTNSTAPTDGALVVNGGLGVGQDINAGGQISADTFLVTSDATLKHNIEDLSSPLQKIRAIEAKQYSLHGEDKTRYGVMAQDLEENGLGHLVSQVDDHKAVDYNGLIGVLLGAIKELDEEVKTLRKSLI